MEQVADQMDTERKAPSSRSGSETNDSKRDLTYMKRIGGWHASAVVAALTLFGAAYTWAAFSGWMLAEIVSVAAAVVAAMVMSSIVHEWGHFAAARLSGAISPVLSKPRRLYFMFNFDMQSNSVKQAVWMSWGGLIGSWSLVVALFVLVPLNSLAAAALIATLTGRAVNATVFEFPIIQRTTKSGEFEKELKAQLDDPGLVRMPGLVVGLISLVALA